MASSALLRALSEKLIPGVPLNTRISILQQTASDQAPSEGRAGDSTLKLSDKPVLQQVIESDTYRNEILGEINSESIRPMEMGFKDLLRSDA